MLFFSNFNGSWAQYVDSFHMAIPNGLDLAWYKNVKYPKSVPLQPFHRYITYNQIWTNHYYNAYPMASSNDIKGSQALKDALQEFIGASAGDDPEQFKQRFEDLLLEQQGNLGLMEATPIVSLSADAVLKREEWEERNPRKEREEPNQSEEREERMERGAIGEPEEREVEEEGATHG